jgi:hypothetical protein
MLKLGDTFLAGDDEEENYHLHVVLTPPNADRDVVLVSITTLRRWSDKTVVLAPGDHPFLKHASCVSYQHAIIRNIDQLDAGLRARPGKVREPLNAALLRRIQFGLLESDFTENGVRHFFKEIYPRLEDL